MTTPIEYHEGNKYVRVIRSCKNDDRTIYVDVYEVLAAFGVTSQARGHAIEKLLCAGIRGKGDELADLKEALAALNRDIEQVERGYKMTVPVTKEGREWLEVDNKFMGEIRKVLGTEKHKFDSPHKFVMRETAITYKPGEHVHNPSSITTEDGEILIAGHCFVPHKPMDIDSLTYICSHCKAEWSGVYPAVMIACTRKEPTSERNPAPSEVQRPVGEQPGPAQDRGRESVRHSEGGGETGLGGERGRAEGTGRPATAGLDDHGTITSSFDGSTGLNNTVINLKSPPIPSSGEGKSSDAG